MQAVMQSFKDITLNELLLWKRPTASGVVVGSIMTFLFLVGYMEYTMLTLLCRAFQLSTVVWFVLSKIGQAPEITSKDINDFVMMTLKGIEQYVITYADLAVSIITWKDSAMSAKALGVSFLVSFIGGCFSDLTLIFLITVAAFGGPITYVQNKELIDAQIEQARPMIEDVLSKIPMLNMQKEKKE